MVITKPTNHIGLPVNEAHHLARFSDDQVHRARALRAGGATLRAVAAAIGCHPSTAHRWATNSMRRPAVAVRVVRVKSPESLHSNRQRQGEEGALPPRHTVTDTVNATVHAHTYIEDLL